MKRYLGPMGLLLSAVLLLASCLKNDDEDVTLYDDTAITSFQITTAKIYKHTVSSVGADSVYVETSTAVSNYPFSIDHLNGTIVNRDSLPAGTDASKLLCSYTSKNNGYVLIKSVGSDSLRYLSTTDSTDFTTDRTLTVLSSDGQHSRNYTVTVNVHKEDGSQFVWHDQVQNPAFDSFQGLKAVVLDSSLYVYGCQGQATKGYVLSARNGEGWKELGVAFGPDAYKSVAVKDGHIYLLDNGALQVSDNGENFTAVASATPLTQLLGASYTELYALSADSQLVVSTDGGHTWGVDALDTDASRLPSLDLTLSHTAFAYSDSTDYVLLAGNRPLTVDSTGRTATVWRKIVEYASVKEPAQWSYMAFDDTNHYPLPRLSQLTVLPYDKKYLAFGAAGMGGCTESAFDRVYESVDGGLTWKVSASYSLPATFDATTATYAATVDAANNIWLVNGKTGRVWKGRLNRLGWK